MNNNPLISIALSTYNGEKFLREQLNSLLSQTYRPVEIVIVDDCSTDNTCSIIESYLIEYPTKIKFFKNSINIGYNKSFEKAFSLCVGDFIAISDQDDIWLPEKIEVLYDLLGADNLIYSNSTIIDEEGEVLLERKFKKLYSPINDPRIFSLKSFVSGHAVLFKRSMLRYIIPIPDYGYYDWWMSIIVANFGGIRCTDMCLTKHRIHKKNVSKKCDFSKEEGYLSLSRWMNEILKIEDLKYRSFFKQLHRIASSKSILKDLCFVLFQLKYSRVIFFNKKNVLSRLNAARKINLFVMPDNK